MYKITAHGKTLVGCNEDAWRTTPHIWFEAATKSQYAVCFTGSRFIQQSSYAAQSGMNAFGVVYSRLSAYTAKKKGWETQGKKIADLDEFLKIVLRSCNSLEEVKALWSRYDHSMFREDVFIYVDRAGNYLIVEPYSLTLGSDPTYLLSNFCPSQTTEDAKRKLDRYRLGAEFVERGVRVSDSYARNLSKKMHVCRDKIGDGTLLTSIWNPLTGEVDLYFYHNFKQRVRFNLAEEFKKGNHQLAIAPLFPKNQEFTQLSEYITPFNSPNLRLFLAFLGMYFLLVAVLFARRFYRFRGQQFNRFMLVIVLANCLITSYLMVLITQIDVFYFSAPFVHFNNVWITASSFIPLVLLAACVPVVIHLRKVLRIPSFRKIRYLLIFNGLCFLVSLGWFFYWGLLIVV
jgi:hypothetical protein